MMIIFDMHLLYNGLSGVVTITSHTYMFYFIILLGKYKVFIIWDCVVLFKIKSIETILYTFKNLPTIHLKLNV